MTRRTAPLALLAAGVWLAVTAAAAPAGDGMRAPGYRAGPRRPLGTRPPVFATAPARPQEGLGLGFWQGLLGFYRTVVSPVDGDRCSMAPTCSLYARQALETHGILFGIVLTADRLIHEADEIPRAPRVTIGGETYYRDSLENNTYWLR